MNRLMVSTFIQTLIPCLDDQNTNEDSFNLIFKPICKELGLDSVSSKTVSMVLNNKEAVPEDYRKAANTDGVQADIKKNFEYIATYLMRNALEKDLRYNFSSLIENDPDISPDKRTELISLLDKDMVEFLTQSFIYAVLRPFQKRSVFSEIYYCSSVIKYDENCDMLSKLKEQYGAFTDLDKRKTKSDATSGKELSDNSIYKLTASCSFESVFIRGNYMAKVIFKYNNKEYQAFTSCNNWLSQSKLNVILSGGTMIATMVFQVVNSEKGTVQIIIMGEL